MTNIIICLLLGILLCIMIISPIAAYLYNKREREYHYFVACAFHTTKEKVFLNCVIIRHNEITSIKEIKDIAESIENDNDYPKGSICILNYQLLNK